MTATATPPPTGTLAQVLARASDADQWARFERQLRSAGYCRHPVRLRGQVDGIDVATGEIRTIFSTATEPDETLLKCCGNRREAVCPSCAEVYRGDAFQLIAAGLRGGKGVPESAAEHPVVFATLTAPSFGPVHSRRVGSDGRARRCRPRRDAPVCPHGARLSCGEVHAEDDPRLGEPICPDCFEYEHAVLWNALAPELWRRTAIQIPRELARLTGVTHRRLRERVRVSYVKVAEYQARGALHFHVVVRLDAAQPKDRAELIEPPPADVTAELLADAIRAAAAHTTAPIPQPTDTPAPCSGATRARGARDRPAGDRLGRPGRRAPARTRRGGVVRRLHREVRDQEHRGGRWPALPAVGARRREPAGAAARRAHGALRVGPGNSAASSRAAAAAVGARARLPRALLHQEPPLLDHVHPAAPGAARAPAAPRARRRAARPMGPPDERRRVRRAAALGVHRASATARSGTRGSPRRPPPGRASAAASRVRSSAAACQPETKAEASTSI